MTLITNNHIGYWDIIHLAASDYTSILIISFKTSYTALFNFYPEWYLSISYDNILTLVHILQHRRCESV